MDRFPGANGLHFERLGPGRYRTTCDHHVQTGIYRADPAMDQQAGIKLHMDGWLEIRAGYVWDGPSGPSIHSQCFMRGSLYHDALYDLMRSGRLPQEYRKRADQLLSETCKQDGMTGIRAAWVYAGVRTFGGYYAGQEPQAASRRER